MPTQDHRPRQAQLMRALGLIVVLLVAYRLAYHASYLGEVPFAHATFADGAVYERAARDILAHPPVGEEAFHVQGAYAYLLALGITVQPWPSMGLLLQLLVAFAALGLFYRSAVRLWGGHAGRLSTIALLAHPALAFFENKYLSAELGIACNILVLAGFVALLRAVDCDEAEKGQRRERLLAALGFGLALGLAILARPNMLVALPLCLIAVASLVRGDARSGEPSRRRDMALTVGASLLGTLLALAPMAARNLAVTGHADVVAVEGGGVSLFVGNNPESTGTWNDGGLLGGQVGADNHELAQALGVDPTLPDRARARAISGALRGRSLQWIGDNPGAWGQLELRKLWQTLGDQQLTHNYDWLGERELLPWAHRVGLSFSMLLALGLLGAGAVLGGRWRLCAGSEEAGESDELDARARRTWNRRHARRALGWFLLGLLGAPLVTNLLYFTSAEHRLPLVLPLALLAGPGLLALITTIRERRAGAKGLPLALLVLAGLVLIQGPWDRIAQDHPRSTHYYNLAVVQDSIGLPRGALASLDRAIELHPREAAFHGRRAHLRFRLEDFDGAEEDLAVVFEIAEAEGVADWVLDQARLDRGNIIYQREMLSADWADGS